MYLAILIPIIPKISNNNKNGVRVRPQRPTLRCLSSRLRHVTGFDFGGVDGFVHTLLGIDLVHGCSILVL